MNKFNLMGPGSRADVIPFEEKDFWRFYSKNTGNMLFYHACERIIEFHETRYGWGGISGDTTLSDGLILPMANQIGTHFNLLEQGPKISNIDKPLLAVGLGSQLDFTEDNLNSIPQGSIEWVKCLASKTKSRNIAVRGSNTKKFLDRMGVSDSVVVTGCPSLMINPNADLGERIKAKYEGEKNELFNNLTVSAGDPYHKEMGLSEVERNFISFVNKYNGSYVVQNPQMLIKMTSSWYDDPTDAEYGLLAKRWFNGLTNKEIRHWFRQYALTFFSIPSWLYYLSNRSLVIGTRIHGIQAAIQSGTPAICFYIDSRTKELCDIMQIPSAPASKYFSGLKESDCIEILASWDEKAFDRNRLELAGRFKEFFASNGVKTKTGCLLV